MAKPHFNIEKSRKINIAIHGYDPVKAVKVLEARVRAQLKKSAAKKVAANTPVKPQPQAALPATTEAEVVELNASLVAKTKPDVEIGQLMLGDAASVVK